MFSFVSKKRYSRRRVVLVVINATDDAEEELTALFSARVLIKKGCAITCVALYLTRHIVLQSLVIIIKKYALI